MDLNKLTKKEIKSFAKKLAKFNTLAWNFVCETEDFAKDPIFMNFSSIEHEEFLIKLAKEYKNIDKKDEDFADLTLNGAYFQDIDYFTATVDKMLDKLDGQADKMIE